MTERPKTQTVTVGPYDYPSLTCPICGEHVKLWVIGKVNPVEFTENNKKSTVDKIVYDFNMEFTPIRATFQHVCFIVDKEKEDGSS